MKNWARNLHVNDEILLFYPEFQMKMVEGEPFVCFILQFIDQLKVFRELL